MAYKVTMGKLAAQKGKEFDEVMEYRDAFQATVSILMGKEVTLLDKAETEKEFRVSPELRQSRLDSVAVDEDRVVYMVEMQKRSTKDLRF